MTESDRNPADSVNHCLGLCRERIVVAKQWPIRSTAVPQRRLLRTLRTGPERENHETHD
jgi:hypothetical protein